MIGDALGQLWQFGASLAITGIWIGGTSASRPCRCQSGRADVKRGEWSAEMSETNAMKDALKALIDMAKAKNRDSKITTKAGMVQTISGYSVQDQQIAFGEVSVSWTDGTRTYLVLYDAIDHIVVV
jgi:hypothetical protein